MTYAEYVKAYETMLTVYLKGYKPTNNPTELKVMMGAADKIVDFEETHKELHAIYEAANPQHYSNFQP